MASGSAQRRVLVVDDSPLVLEMLGSALAEIGIVVDTANDLGALEQLRAAAPPDMIVLDIQMPEAFGDDIASTLRGAYGVTAPILLMSTLPDEELEARAAQAGADGWVSKRSGIQNIVTRVTSMLSALGEGARR